MPDTRNLTRDLTHVLAQGIRAVESLDARSYAASPEPLGPSGIGAHLRHCQDFLDRLLIGVESGEVNYAQRDRDARYEVDADYAVARLRETSARLGALAAVPVDRPLKVRSDSLPNDPPLDSTLGRELEFVLSHTIHHYALIAMCMRHFGVVPEEEFGVAPSTLRYWRETGRCAPSAG